MSNNWIHVQTKAIVFKQWFNFFSSLSNWAWLFKILDKVIHWIRLCTGQLLIQSTASQWLKLADQKQRQWLDSYSLDTILSCGQLPWLLALKPLNQITLSLAGMVLGWVPFKIVSDSPALHSRWLLLLKMEISSIVHCCFSINQNELKF
jgi:hypothetical protein